MNLEETDTLYLSDEEDKVIDEIVVVPTQRASLYFSELLLFNDGKRKIDFVIAYDDEENTRKKLKRKTFEEHLISEGLELELENAQDSFDGQTSFLKLHAPWSVLTRYAELLNMKMPIKEKEQMEPKNKINKIRKFFEFGKPTVPPEPSFYKSNFSQDKEEQFIIKDRETFFTSAQRSFVVWQILLRTRYDKNTSQKAGIRRLLNSHTYIAAYPLHEGKYDETAPDGKMYDRQLLYEEWGRPGRWYKKQPLWLIRRYFGEKVGLYFAWLGFYTTMLIPASVIGIFSFLYGLASMDSRDNIPSQEICDTSGPGNITLCPLCDKLCDYQKLSSSCTFAKLTYLFDNPATVFFAIFMSFWATSFLELWKRRQAVIKWEWDLQYVDHEEEPRPEFESSVNTYRINPVTHQREPYMPTWNKVLRLTATGSMVFFMMFVVLGAVLGTIIYRLSIASVLFSSDDSFLKAHAKIFTSITAAVLNLCIIMLLNRLYQNLALWLTNVENPRTQSEYEDSFTFKMFLFQFINFYSSLIYIAFFKGRFFDHPGDDIARSSEFLRLKGDVCDPSGCLSELCIQLAIIMVGKQFINNFMEILVPKLKNWWAQRKQKAAAERSFESRGETMAELTFKRWEEDFRLQDEGRMALFHEYLEMVLQYGFVTLFVAAFPLAPVFALMNNIAEIRLDAYKMLTQARRPLAERVDDIGAWYGILQGLTYTAVVTNAFVIAYTSEFIPRMVYKVKYSKSYDLVGYIDATLSTFNTSDYGPNMGPEDRANEPETCQYRAYRNGPSDPKPYDLSQQYWHVFAARLAFVVVFEHIVFALTGIMAYAIPDIPREIRTQIQRERLLAKEARFEQELNRNLGQHQSENDNDDVTCLDNTGTKFGEMFTRRHPSQDTFRQPPTRAPPTDPHASWKQHT